MWIKIFVPFYKEKKNLLSVQKCYFHFLSTTKIITAEWHVHLLISLIISVLKTKESDQKKETVNISYSLH